MKENFPLKTSSQDIPPRKKPSLYPAPFAERMNGRIKKQLGDFFGLTKFGVNLTTIAPGGESALLHQHSKQEEFIFVLEGNPTLVTDHEEIELAPGDCTGFRPGQGAHKLINRSNSNAVFLEVGDREAGDEVTYPQDDLIARSEEGIWKFYHKDGTPW